VRGLHPSNSLPLWQQAPKRELLRVVVLLLIITIVFTTTIVVFFAFILMHQNQRAKIFAWISNRRRIKDPRLMERRVRNVCVGTKLFLALFNTMVLLSMSFLIPFSLPSILPSHVETSKHASSKIVQFAFLILWNTMRVRRAFNR
jgi:hypothetical protein